MSTGRLEKMTNAQLLERFIEITTAQDRALLYSQIAKYNRLFDQMVAVEKVLKGRPNDQRRELLALFTHPNVQVRLQAARATLAVAPAAARQMIEDIANSRKFPQAGDAGMTIWNLDRGVYKPK